jgi:hypothetical protein
MRRVSAAIIVLALLALAALAVAQEGVGTDVAEVASAGAPAPDHGATVSDAAKKNKLDAEQSQKPESDPSEDAREAAEQKKEDSEQGSGDRPKNHGYYVSQAAQCIDVHLSGVAIPNPCEGRAKGEYVSSVARSDLGKPSATEEQQGSAPATPGKGPKSR